MVRHEQSNNYFVSCFARVVKIRLNRVIRVPLKVEAALVRVVLLGLFFGHDDGKIVAIAHP